MSPEELERCLRIPLTEEMEERDPDFSELKKPNAVFRF